MDKKKPTYRLKDIHRLAKQGQCKLTITAQQTADSFGFSQSEIRGVIMGLETKDFYKSVNEYRNHKIWQDVYRKRVHDITLYIKLKILDTSGQLLLILSFKKQ